MKILEYVKDLEQENRVEINWELAQLSHAIKISLDAESQKGHITPNP